MAVQTAQFLVYNLSPHLPHEKKNPPCLTVGCMPGGFCGQGTGGNRESEVLDRLEVSPALPKKDYCQGLGADQIRSDQIIALSVSDLQ